MARLALALDPATEDRLLADAVEHGHTIVARLVGWRDVLESLDVLAPDVVLVGAGRATLSGELLAGCDDRGIRLIALAAADADRAHAAQLGLHEVLDRSAHWTAIDALVRGGVPVPSRLGDREPRARRAAEVIAVWGPAGAPGRTTLAVNLAAEIAAAGHSVALVDADPYGGAIAPALGLLDEAPGPRVRLPPRRGRRARPCRARAHRAAVLRSEGLVRRVHRTRRSEPLARAGARSRDGRDPGHRRSRRSTS